MIYVMRRGVRAAGGLITAYIVTTSLALSPARAASGCEGIYSATLLHALPAPLVVHPDIGDQSPSNLRIVNRLIAGLRDMGVAVNGPTNATLQVSTSLMFPSSDVSRGSSEQSYTEFGALDGDADRGTSRSCSAGAVCACGGE